MRKGSADGAPDLRGIISASTPRRGRSRTIAGSEFPRPVGTIAQGVFGSYQTAHRDARLGERGESGLGGEDARAHHALLPIRVKSHTAGWELACEESK